MKRGQAYLKGLLLSGILGFALLLSCTVKSVNKSADSVPIQKEEKALRLIDRLLQQGAYQKAHRYLLVLQSADSLSPFADDVAYRLAYLHVIADSANPYFNYRQAWQAFRRFRKKYPKSIYSSACNNWLKILYLLFNSKREQNQWQRKADIQQKECEHLRRENAELKKTLRDLEHVIQRNE